MNIKEIALKVWDSNMIECSPENLTNFAEALVAELAKENKPALVMFQHDETGRTTSIEPSLADDFERMNKRWYRAGNLYTTPPTAEQIEQETAEACAKFVYSTKGAKGVTYLAEALLSGKWKEYKK